MNRSLQWQKVALSVLCVVLALVLIVLTFATVYINYLMGQVGRFDGDQTLSPEQLATATESIDPSYTGPYVDPTDVTLDILPTESIPTGSLDSSVVNILLVGQDRRPGEPNQRSDVMLLCSFNTTKKTLTLISFLRDTYVYIPRYGNNKLNAAYQFGGFSLLNETLAVNFGVHVDGNAEVDFNRFTDIIDLLGGVDIELSAAEAKYMNEHLGFEFNHDQKWNLKEGVNRLTGDQALAYSRIRYVSTINGTKNDWGRTERQRRVINALIEAYKNQPLLDMLGMLDDILPMVTTNLSDADIFNYVVTLFPMLSSAQIETVAIPSGNTFKDQNIAGLGACLVPDLATIRSQLMEILSTD